MLHSWVWPSPWPGGIYCLAGKRHTQWSQCFVISRGISKTAEWVNASSHLEDNPKLPTNAPSPWLWVVSLSLSPDSLQPWLLERALHFCSISLCPCWPLWSTFQSLMSTRFFPFVKLALFSHCLRLGSRPTPTWGLICYKSICFPYIISSPQDDLSTPEARLYQLLP